MDALGAMFQPQMQAINTLILEQIGSDVPQVQAVARYLIESGGKRIRPLLSIASAALFREDVSPACALSGAVEFIHSATLLHDDVVDESDQRRGKDTANVVHGNAMTVLVGDFLFSRAFQLMVKTGDLRILKSLSDAAAIIAEGEVLQLSHIGDLNMDIAIYDRIIGAKTAALFAAACETGALSVGASDEQAKALKDYGYHLGMAFQVTDDVMDYAADEAGMGKKRGDDFREGKPTLPVLLARHHDSAFWTRTIIEKKQTDTDLETARRYMDESGALRQGLHTARNHAQQAALTLAKLPQSPVRDLLNDLTQYVVTRKG